MGPLREFVYLYAHAGYCYSMVTQICWFARKDRSKSTQHENVAEIITKITERKPIQQKGKKRKQQAKTRSIYQESKRPKQTIRKTNETELPERLGHIQIKHDKNQFKQAMTTIGNNIDNVSSKNAKLGGNLEKVMRGIGVTILPTIGNHVSLQQNHTPTHKTKKVTHQKSVQYKNKHQLPKKLQKHGG